MTTEQTTIHSVKRHSGIAGQFGVTADVQYDEEERRTVEFVGSTYGGPVVMRMGPIETFVSDPSRFGQFSADPIKWVREFFSA
jgi:hypothetical protein